MLTTSLTFLLTASVVLGGPTLGRHRGCATHIDHEEVTEPTAKIANTAIKVYWHVISKDSKLAGGNIPDSQIANQISVLNKDYAGNITWTLGGTTRTVNADWFNNVGPSTSQRTAMKASRQGGKGDLNVYSVGFVSGSAAGLLGYSTFPSVYSSAPKDEGIVILFSSVPGGSTTGYNLGRGGCAGSGSATAGDYVADTPAESTAASGCPSGRDTCTGASFLALAPNFMNYSCDACMTQFSAGQMARAETQFATYWA
ncbi:hypothetical protein B0H17DRAFT_1161806 [Mycena rosella]|uniref:Uncharacterized protein n=1 Tax=Mycena rosella TaxID=1033263 RepID=A0AAD7GAX2_MYCRO|nr:hypothetical protein B0H17DRAFT_1161806 [Mycena rosella]